MEFVGKKARVADDQEVDWHGLYLDLLPKIFHYFAYRVGDVQIAEDLAGTAFERAWRKRNRYRKDLGKFESWVFGIARKVAGEYFRKSKREPQAHQVPNIPDGHDVGKAFDEQTDFDQLQKLLTDMDQKDRHLLSLKYGAGITNRDIAQITGLSESNVGTKLHRLVTKLRSEWEKT
ncbi:MAG: sigma-70 family RNA polymerase sigma factor [Chloroflexi bacterium]|nr:sigma-70 family RNA polymerase sigma factor [Chloroflexota bacterium]